MNFASKSVIHENPLVSFTCRKAGTWGILFYFPSDGRHTEDFPDARKMQRLRPGLNPRTRVPVASMLTTRPPKPSIYNHVSTSRSLKNVKLLRNHFLPIPMKECSFFHVRNEFGKYKSLRVQRWLHDKRSFDKS